MKIRILEKLKNKPLYFFGNLLSINHEFSYSLILQANISFLRTIYQTKSTKINLLKFRVSLFRLDTNNSQHIIFQISQI